MFEAFEAKVKAFIATLDGEAKADLEKALAGAKAELASLSPVVSQFEADLKAAVAAAEPAVKAAVEGLLAKLIADFAPMLGTAPLGHVA
jgi:hypothetical protein